jgi:hypothetical protein
MVMPKFSDLALIKELCWSLFLALHLTASSYLSKTHSDSLRARFVQTLADRQALPRLSAFNVWHKVSLSFFQFKFL